MDLLGKSELLGKAGGEGAPLHPKIKSPTLSRRNREIRMGHPNESNTARTLRLDDEIFSAQQFAAGGRYSNRTGAGAWGDRRDQVGFGENLEIRGTAVECDFGCPGQVRTQEGDGLAFLAGKQRRVDEWRQAHIQAVNGAVVGAATELGDAVEQAVGPLDWRRQRRHSA